jgi:beta-glucosidase-like glycosyl hydrolase
VPVSEADPVIGNRAYGTTPAKVAEIGAAVAQGLIEGGVLPVLKHIPGHGRATATAIIACRSSRSIAPPWSQAILRRSVRSPNFPWG